MIAILFWNIRKKSILDRVARIAGRYDVDVLVLAECEAEESGVLAALAEHAGTGWHHPPSVPSKLKVFSHLPVGNVTEVFSTANERLTIRETKSASGSIFFLAAVHLVAKSGGWTDHSQSSVARHTAEDIERVELLRQNPRTVLIGDLNMAPFAPGMIDGFVFHSFMTRELATRRTERTVQGTQCRRAFFNPMWRLMTDRGGKPPGTYYWHESLPDNHYWYMLDQVLVRPELADKVVSVDIIDTDGLRPLTTDNGWPDAENASDHLPILAVLDL